MLITLRLLNASGGTGGTKKSSRAGSYEKWWDSMSPAEKVITVVISVVLYLGTCVIVGRSHPDWSLGWRILAYVLLLPFYELYLLYFCARLVVAQARGESSVYARLPRYTPLFGAARKV